MIDPLSSIRDEGRGRDIPHRSMHGHRSISPGMRSPRGCLRATDDKLKGGRAMAKKSKKDKKGKKNKKK